MMRSRMLRGAEKSRAIVKYDFDGNLLHEACDHVFLKERLHEAAIRELGCDAGGDASSDVESTHGNRVQREVPCLRAVNRQENVECLF